MSIHHGNQILKIMTRLIITLTSASECLELRRTEKDSRDYSYPKVRFQLMYHRRVHSRLIPAVGKSEDLLVERHFWRHRQIGAPSPASSVKPHLQSRSEKSAYSAYELISAIPSTL